MGYTDDELNANILHLSTFFFYFPRCERFPNEFENWNFNVR